MGGIKTKPKLLERPTAPRNYSLRLRDFDKRVLAYLARRRLRSSAQIVTICAERESHSYCLHRLQELFRIGYLDRLIDQPKRLARGRGSPCLVYALGNRGVRVMRENGAGPLALNQTKNNRLVKEPFILHELLIGQVEAVMHRACQKVPLANLAFWHEAGLKISFFTHKIHSEQDLVLWSGAGAQPRSSAQDRRQLLAKVALEEAFCHTVAPDAYFGLRTLSEERGELLWSYLVEADRSTEDLARILRKYRDYFYFHRLRLQAKEPYNIKNFRVLFVTKSVARRDNLIRTLETEDRRRRKTGLAGDFGGLFLFATESDLALDRPEQIFQPIWFRAGGEEAIGLLPG